MTQICLRVSGIVCDGCRTLVEAALRDAEKDGARSTFQWSECEGFPDTGDVLLHSEASTDDLIAAVKATGRECATVEPAVWRTTRLKVGGMTCGHCSGLVERTLAAVEGVASASVDLAAAQATVVGTASAEVLVAAVAAAQHARGVASRMCGKSVAWPEGRCDAGSSSNFSVYHRVLARSGGAASRSPIA